MSNNKIDTKKVATKKVATKKVATKKVATKKVATKKDGTKIKLTLVKSLSGRLKAHQACAKGLGIKKIHRSIEVNNTPENMGMINKINYLLKIEKNNGT
ncbi:MAG: 50S ribosomal protein L30 [Gammaproteobacteria bacterium]|jgi:large subunit ribosomal protein L30|nr:50S ribosomal protein L30 [Gammaproteobacteria bacterium]MBT7603556.1 50S ribosomal protein L30 [Gammaproteobacteria bacterium]